MADHSVNEELKESEASKTSVICFDCASPEKYYFLADLGPVSRNSRSVVTGPVKLFCFPFQMGVTKVSIIIQ